MRSSATWVKPGGIRPARGDKWGTESNSNKLDGDRKVAGIKKKISNPGIKGSFGDRMSEN